MSVKRYAAHTNIDDFKSDWYESKDGPMVKHEDYSVLEGKCAALDAEKEKFAVECAATKIAIAYLKSGRQDFTLNTPATDAFLAEVRAQGAEMFAEKLREHIAVDSSGSTRARALTRIVDRASAQLRKGMQS